MEEADARLQEVVASLLNEHGGSHEQALRQTFACLHNSGLYEAQSAAEEEQREQQVLAVFRSFPFRAPAAPAGNGNGNGGGGGTGSLVEETQAPPPPAYHTLAREPEEAGEVTAPQAEADPENVGEDARAQPAPEALLPLNPADHQEQQQQQGGRGGDEDLPAAAAPTPSPGPEVSHQGLAPAPQHLPEQQPQPPAAGPDASSQLVATPESLGSAGFGNGDGGGEAAAAATPATAEGLPAESAGGGWGGGGDGVEETKGGELSEEEARGEGETAGFPETGETVAIAEEACVGEGLAQERGSQQFEAEGGSEGETGDGTNGVASGSREELANGVRGDPAADPESTPRQEGSTEPSLPPAAEPPALDAPPESEASGETIDMDAGASSAVVAAGASTTACATALVSPAVAGGAGAGGAAAAAAAAPPPAAAPTTTAVTEPHLKTAGQPLTHSNRAESPTGMSTDLQAKLKALKLRRKHRFVTMRIEGTEVVPETVAAPAEGPAELRAALPYSDCRYAVYDQEIVTADGRKANKLFFFTWLPHNATPHNKMAYSHGKVTVRQRLEGLYDVAASSFDDIEVALGLVEEDEEDSDIDF